MCKEKAGDTFFRSLATPGSLSLERRAERTAAALSPVPMGKVGRITQDLPPGISENNLAREVAASRASGDRLVYLWW